MTTIPATYPCLYCNQPLRFEMAPAGDQLKAWRHPNGDIVVSSGGRDHHVATPRRS